MLRKTLSALLLASAMSVTAGADTLLIEGVQAAATTQSQRPTRGQSMAQVEARFGSPARTVAAVGDPPISSWEYPGFVVYFEHDLVIHAVPRR